MPIATSAVKALIPHPDVVARSVDQTVVLVHLDTNRIFTLNRTGSRVWDLIVAGHARTEIEHSLQDQYEVGPERLAGELDALVDVLFKEQLVREGEPPPR